jgi:hypothetical protein
VVTLSKDGKYPTATINPASLAPVPWASNRINKTTQSAPPMTGLMLSGVSRRTTLAAENGDDAVLVTCYSSVGWIGGIRWLHRDFTLICVPLGPKLLR